MMRSKNGIGEQELGREEIQLQEPQRVDFRLYLHVFFGALCIVMLYEISKFPRRQTFLQYECSIPC